MTITTEREAQIARDSYLQGAVYSGAAVALFIFLLRDLKHVPGWEALLGGLWAYSVGGVLVGGVANILTLRWHLRRFGWTKEAE